MDVIRKKVVEFPSHQLFRAVIISKVYLANEGATFLHGRDVKSRSRTTRCVRAQPAGAIRKSYFVPTDWRTVRSSQGQIVVEERRAISLRRVRFIRLPGMELPLSSSFSLRIAASTFIQITRPEQHESPVYLWAR